MNKIGIFGGAFNPIHYGHLFIANESIQEFKLKKVVFVPTGNPVFHKDDLLNKFVRLSFVKIAVDSNPRFFVSSFEVERNKPSYFINTLLHLINEEKYAEYYLIIGEDAFLRFHLWKDYEKILELSKIIVAKRFDGSFENTKLYIERYLANFASRIYFLEHPLYPISSTLIRSRIKSGKCISYLLPKKVEEEILRNGYYR